MSYFNYLLLRKSIEFCSNEPCKRFKFKCKEHFCTLIYNLDEMRICFAYTYYILKGYIFGKTFQIVFVNLLNHGRGMSRHILKVTKTVANGK